MSQSSLADGRFGLSITFCVEVWAPGPGIRNVQFTYNNRVKLFCLAPTVTKILYKQKPWVHRAHTSSDEGREEGPREGERSAGPKYRMSVQAAAAGSPSR